MEGGDNVTILTKNLDTEYEYHALVYHLPFHQMELAPVALIVDRTEAECGTIGSRAIDDRFSFRSSLLLACATPMYAVNWPRHVSVEMTSLASMVIGWWQNWMSSSSRIRLCSPRIHLAALSPLGSLPGV